MRLNVGAVIVAALAWGGDAVASSADQAPCTKGKAVVFQLPGVPLEEFYPVAKRRVPAARKCDLIKDPETERCVFVDSYGQKNWVTDHISPRERFIWMKEALRSAGRPIPFGITWKDTPRDVSQKLKSAGFAPHYFPTEKGGVEVEIQAHVCTAIDPLDRVVFEFEGGRLQSVQHRALWP